MTPSTKISTRTALGGKEKFFFELAMKMRLDADVFQVGYGEPANDADNCERSF